MTLDKPWLNASLAVDGFAKPHLSVGEAKEVEVRVRLADLARYDPAAKAYVVDGGEYTFFGGGCVANPALSDAPYAGDACTYDSAATGAKATIGEAGRLYGVYL